MFCQWGGRTVQYVEFKNNFPVETMFQQMCTAFTDEWSVSIFLLLCNHVRFEVSNFDSRYFCTL